MYLYVYALICLYLVNSTITSYQYFFLYNLIFGWHIFIYFTPNLCLRTGGCNVYLIMIWFETGNLEWKFYLLHADRKRLPRTFVCSANADVFHWTWRRRAAESDVTVRLTFGIADVTLRLYINPISTVNEIHYGFNTQHLSERLLKLRILYWRRRS
jgi:hypothetical protein